MNRFLFARSLAVLILILGCRASGQESAHSQNAPLSGKAGQAWSKRIGIDPGDVAGGIAAKKLVSKEAVNWFTGRWPYIGFIGGMAMGNKSEELEFFYSEPFKWYATVLDYVLTNGGKVYGLRAKIHRYKEWGGAKPLRSFLLQIRTDVLLAEYHPSISRVLACWRFWARETFGSTRKRK
jgi:hypothetical protein